MMYLCQNLLLLLLLGLSSPATVNAKLKGRRSLPEVEERRTEELVEPRPCVSFDLPWIQNAIVEGPSNPWQLHSSECDTNDCSDEVSWCCRAYTHALLCDTKNDFRHQPVRKKMIRNVFMIISRPCVHSYFPAPLYYISASATPTQLHPHQPRSHPHQRQHQRQRRRTEVVVTPEVKFHYVIAPLVRFALRVPTVAANAVLGINAKRVLQQHRK
jgi:hypothetical protein